MQSVCVTRSGNWETSHVDTRIEIYLINTYPNTDRTAIDQMAGLPL